MTTNAALTPAAAKTDQAILREVVEALAPIEREAGSPGEREAAEWIQTRLGKAGVEARVEEEEFAAGWPVQHAALAAAGAAAGVLGLSRSRSVRALSAAAGLAIAGLIAEDASNGPRLLRRLHGSKGTTSNVVAEIGAAHAPRTLVLLAHHDAAHTGRIFHQGGQRAMGNAFPGLIERADTSVPLWWLVIAGPLLAAAGAASGRRGLAAAGAAVSAGAAASFADIARSPVVPGANDNLSAVAVLVAVAEALKEKPIGGLRVVLASCGAEEVLQGGIYGFADRHLAEMDPERTWVLNLDTIGSPELVLLEGEGEILMEDYFDRGWRDLIARVAEREGIPVRRGMRAFSSTDAVIPSRMRIPTASVASMDSYKALSNYHWPTDTPENLSYPTVACAADLTLAVVRELGTEPA
jgi:Zn-dependent M28 family amino/carboxypeptidase